MSGEIVRLDDRRPKRCQQRTETWSKESQERRMMIIKAAVYMADEHVGPVLNLIARQLDRRKRRKRKPPS